MVVAWLRPAAEFRDGEVDRLRALSHAELLAISGSEELAVPPALAALGCRAHRLIERTTRGTVSVRVQVNSPDALSNTSDGFTMSPSGKVQPVHPDQYDD
jgi:hypothetical protein